MPKTYSQQLQAIYDQYQEEVSTGPIDLAKVAHWAIRRGLWKPHPEDLASKFRSDMARALREEYAIDEKGRSYRKKHAVRVSRGGKQTSLWADIDTAPPEHMRKAFAQRRNQIVGDCYQLRTDVDHFNDVNKAGEVIQLLLDFTQDVEERLIEKELSMVA